MGAARKEFTLAEVAERIGAVVHGNGDARVRRLGSLENAASGELTHFSNPAYRRFLAGTAATAVILHEKDAADCPTNALVTEDPYHAFAVASEMFDPRPATPAGTHASATVAPTARIGEGVAIAPAAVVMTDVVLGDRVEIGAGAFVGAGTVVGEDTVVMPNATLCHGVRIGRRCVIHSGAVIGGDGFGFAPDAAGRFRMISQLGSVRIGDDVRVGACTTIDRGAIDDTVIERGVKIDNLVQVGHNCRIGADTVLCGCVGLAGSTRIGRRCILGGAVGVAGDGPVEICDGVSVSAMTHVAASIREPGIYSGGVPHNTNRRWRRNVLRFAQLDGIAKRLAKLERKLERKLEKKPEKKPEKRSGIR